MNGSAQQDGGFVGNLGSTLATPFSSKMTWTQLAAVTVFVLVVAFAWRQVVMFISKEV